MILKDNNYPHESVLVEEMLDAFKGSVLNVFFEGTVGAGGHAEAILKAHPEIKMYIGCDQDETALAIARKRLAAWEDKLHLIHGNFSHLREYLEERKIKEVDGFFLI